MVSSPRFERRLAFADHHLGISPTTTKPFSPPLAYRRSPRKQNHKNEKGEILEGQCHKCRDWAAVEGVKCVEAKVCIFYSLPNEKFAHGPVFFA